MADTQLGMLRENKSWEEEIGTAQLAVQRLNRLRPKPAFAIVCGDLVHAYPDNPNVQDQQIKDFKTIFSDLDADIPLVCLCGNHDVGDLPTVDSLQRYTSEFGDDYLQFWVGGVKCLVLNSSLCSNVGWYQGKWRTDPPPQPQASLQKAWLLEELARCRTEKPEMILVFSHIPPFIQQPDEEKGYFNWEPQDRQVYLKAMKQAGVRAWFCGHYHANAGGFDEDLEVVVTAAVGCVLTTTGSPLSLPVKLLGVDPDLSGFRIVKVCYKIGLDGGQETAGTAAAAARRPVPKATLGLCHKWFPLNQVPATVDPANLYW
eukprot:gb/GEZN01011545.1/.p1 GENE.gb/GEZN01011545.1/~~gb/GEZN01011545.1/.p1  ORF type:complete len:352 (-),score=45.98 gb/GEZN01011545.1/:94-1041(-)